MLIAADGIGDILILVSRDGRECSDEMGVLGRLGKLPSQCGEMEFGHGEDASGTADERLLNAFARQVIGIEPAQLEQR